MPEASTNPATEPISSDDAETLFESNQRMTSFGAVLGSVGLAIQNIMGEVIPHSWPFVAMIFTSLAGWIVFGLGVFRNRRLGRTVEGKAFFDQARTDERLNRMRSEAFAYGFGTMIGLQVVLLLLFAAPVGDLGGALTLPVAASATIAAGVAGAVLRHQILSSR